MSCSDLSAFAQEVGLYTGMLLRGDFGNDRVKYKPKSKTIGFVSDLQEN